VIEQRGSSLRRGVETCYSEVSAYPPFSIGLSRNYSRFVGKPEVIRAATW
jgi:hypothetical protein